MSDRGILGREARSERPDAGDERQGVGTSGVRWGTSGDLLRAYGLIVPLILLATTVNTLSTLYDIHRGGHEVPLWEPALWEGSSGVALMVAVLVVHAASLLAPPAQTGWGRLLLVNLLATLPFSALHSGGMFVLRWLVYRIQGLHYAMSAGDILYEYRKDLLTYAILYGAFRITARPRPATVPMQLPASAEALFDIIDGARTHRVPLGAVLSLRAAGNYVEFQLADGARPLMRTSLQDMQERLAPHGFLRTHRSWIVNPARIRTIEAIGSGDFLLTLETGDEAPLSRRFPEALAQLRKKEGAALATPSPSS
jgi:hypothetical protein